MRVVLIFDELQTRKYCFFTLQNVLEVCKDFRGGGVSGQKLKNKNKNWSYILIQEDHHTKLTKQHHIMGLLQYQTIF